MLPSFVQPATAKPAHRRKGSVHRIDLFIEYHTLPLFSSKICSFRKEKPALFSAPPGK